MLKEGEIRLNSKEREKLKVQIFIYALKEDIPLTYTAVAEEIDLYDLTALGIMVDLAAAGFFKMEKKATVRYFIPDKQKIASELAFVGQNKVPLEA